MEKKKSIRPVGQTAPQTKFLIGGHTFAIADFVGVTAKTIKARLEKAGIKVSTKWANAFYERINKEDKEG